MRDEPGLPLPIFEGIRGGVVEEKRRGPSNLKMGESGNSVMLLKARVVIFMVGIRPGNGAGGYGVNTPLTAIGVNTP